MPAEHHNVSIVEDDATLRGWLIGAIKDAPGWEVRGAYARGESAMVAILKDPPHAVIVDIQLPGMSGIDLVSSLKEKCPDTQFLMVTVYDDADRVFKALAAGASGYLLKRDVPAKLLVSLDDVLVGGSPMSGTIARKVVQHFYKPVTGPGQSYNLTSREAETLEMLSKGLLCKEISEILEVRPETIRFHLANIYKKLHVRTRTEAVIKYMGG